MRHFILIILFLQLAEAKSQTINITGPAGSGQFGKIITVLTNGNYVVTDPLYDNGAVADAGVVYLYNGSTHTLISTLKGSTANDQVGSGGIITLSNGNFILYSPNWDNGAVVNAGAVTWCNGVTGLAGIVNSSNSLVGSKSNDNVGSGGIISLSNGNYVVSSLQWDNGTATDAGAITWGNGTSGIAGIITASNSLIGTTANDVIGLGGITILANNNFIVRSPSWDEGMIANVGAVTWCNGSSGRTGFVSFGNSLIGNRPNDQVGSGGITILTNGNYVVKSPGWNNAAIGSVGAVTWCNGASGGTGTVNNGNSLIGVVANDRAGSGGVTALSNGNYVVISPLWDNGVINLDAGAVTFCNGAAGISGTISSSNSLVGGTVSDQTGSGGVTALSNGNYLVTSPNWDNGAKSNAGAITWGNGTTGVKGIVSSSNSIIGNTAADQLGSGGIIALSNGNGVVKSPNWDNETVVDAGAVTWVDGSTGITGIVSSSNSLVGSTGNDQLGGGIDAVIALNNGNYVVSSINWDNGAIVNAGAATWANGTTGISGSISGSNSLVGSTTGDRVSSYGIKALSNENYIVLSPAWDNDLIIDAGAVTWGNGTTGISGIISSSNSLTGGTANDQVGVGDLVPNVITLNNGNYVVASSHWANGAASNTGAVTWCDGDAGTTGLISVNNSLIGNKAGAHFGVSPLAALSSGNYLIRSWDFDNGAIVAAGAATLINGITGKTGVISSSNSIVGNITNDWVGYWQVTDLGNGNYVLISPNWDYGSIVNAGAVTLLASTSSITGSINSCNSVLGEATSEGSLLTAFYNNVYHYLIVGRQSENIISIFNPVILPVAVMQDSATENISNFTATTLIANGGCRIIATLTPGGANPVAGTVTAKVWVEPAVPDYGGDIYAARHYEITPVTNASSATGRVTLYFSQQEFDDFNAASGSVLDLPVNNADASGISNLRIGKYSGTSNDGSGLPGTYSGTPLIIDPADADIIWNNSLNRWEISFDVTGFSGFVVQTKATPLPLQLLSFAAAVSKNDVLVNWKTTNEINTKNFKLERSTDGRNFITAGTVAAINNSGDQMYNFTDAGAAVLNTDKLYYRLKQTDINGSFRNSQIILLKLLINSSITVYPNPVTNVTLLSINNTVLLNTPAVITDMQGKKIKQFIISNYQQKIDLSNFPNAVYILKLADGTVIKLIKK